MIIKYNILERRNILEIPSRQMIRPPVELHHLPSETGASDQTNLSKSVDCLVTFSADDHTSFQKVSIWRNFLTLEKSEPQSKSLKCLIRLFECRASLEAKCLERGQEEGAKSPKRGEGGEIS
jgi:hypothetical protein